MKRQSVLETHRTRCRVVFLFGMLLILGAGVAPLPCSAQEQDAAGVRSAPAEASMGVTNVLLNPLGFLQFGPIVSLERGLGGSMFVNAHLRYSALGLAYQIIESDGFENSVSLSSMAIGAGLKQFISSGDSPHRLYVGGSLEYGWGATTGDQQSRWEWEGSDAQLSVLMNVGYRWRFPSNHMFVNVGVIGALAYLIKDEWWYTGARDVVFDEAGGAVIFGMLEVSFGWEL